MSEHSQHELRQEQDAIIVENRQRGKGSDLVGVEVSGGEGEKPRPAVKGIVLSSVALITVSLAVFFPLKSCPVPKLGQKAPEQDVRISLEPESRPQAVEEKKSSFGSDIPLPLLPVLKLAEKPTVLDLEPDNDLGGNSMPVMIRANEDVERMILNDVE